LNKHFENLLGGRYTEDFTSVAGEAAGVNFDIRVIAADGSDFGMKETVEFSIPKSAPSAAITLVPKVALSRLFLVFLSSFLSPFFASSLPFS
jgi:hypothetical protein